MCYDLSEAKLHSLSTTEGKTLYVPKIDPSTPGRMEFLKIYDSSDLHSLPTGVWGIKEPDKEWNGAPRPSGMFLDPFFL